MLVGAAATVAGGLVTRGFATPTRPADTGERDWSKVRAAYAPQAPYMNLNNAAVSPAPLVVQKALFDAYQFANTEPDVNMWDVLDERRSETKTKLAALADCAPGEIAINRNSTEALCTAIFGINLSRGDEVVLCEWDYPSVRKAWEQRARRDGVVLREASYDLMAPDDEIVAAYTRALTPRSRVMQLTHMIHWTGRVLPVKHLCELATRQNTLTVIDAAQTFAHLPFSFRELNCDYLATSLHKWLCAPLGTGMLIVKAAHIDTTWPLLAPFDPEPLRIEKFDHWNLGTYCSPLEAAITPAIDFHNSIGTMAVHERLRTLSRYWVDRAAKIDGFRIHTPMDAHELGAVTLFSIAGRDPEKLESRLRERHKIHVRFRRQGSLNGVRVSPHIYTLESDLDRFVAALREAVGG